MALPFWIAMATEWSTSVAASSRDQRDRCSDAAPLIRSSRARASGPSPPHVSTTKGRSSASWRLAMGCHTSYISCLPCQWQWRSLSQAVDGRKRPAGAPPPRPTARAGQGTRSADLGEGRCPLADPFTSRTACPPVSSTARYKSVLDGVVAGADLPVGLRLADQEVPGVVGHCILSLGAQRAVSRQLAVAAERWQAEVEARSDAVLLVQQRGERLSRGSALPGRGVKGGAGSEVSQRSVRRPAVSAAGLQSGRPRGRDCWPGR